MLHLTQPVPLVATLLPGIKCVVFDLVNKLSTGIFRCKLGLSIKGERDRVVLIWVIGPSAITCARLLLERSFHLSGIVYTYPQEGYAPISSKTDDGRCCCCWPQGNNKNHELTMPFNGGRAAAMQTQSEQSAMCNFEFVASRCVVICASSFMSLQAVLVRRRRR